MSLDALYWRQMRNILKKAGIQDAIAAMQRLSSRAAEIRSSAHLMDVDPDQVVQ